MARQKTELVRFIGGKHDGTMMEVMKDQNNIILPVCNSPIAHVVEPNAEFLHSPVEYQTYRRATIRGNTEYFDVMIPPHMTGDQLIRRLILGYKESGTGKER